MARNIIIMDSSASMRRIIRTMIQATISDAVVSEVKDSKAAQGLIEGAHYHLVIFSKESSGKKWLEFAQQRLALPEKQRTNFAMFSSTQKQPYCAELIDYGIEEYFTIPCAANDIGQIITRLCPYDTMRHTKRYSVPDTIVNLAQGSNIFLGEVINFSEGGMLFEIDAYSQIQWFLPVMASLEMKLDGATLKVSGLYTVARHLMVVEMNPDYSPKRIRLACRFISVPEESKNQLAQVFTVIEKKEALFVP
ncbi:MAG TPA: hypothetical protein DEQ20_04550 [Desulfobulbaceae bacterium]|nr:MAG: hypothetical protein A2520_06615 [Deltaproteobacteria bacterium RIFOXYD12_FULL_53_23]HCC54184.1 hypothetical protein [Desulfobulbaceae bacterium]